MWTDRFRMVLFMVHRSATRGTARSIGPAIRCRTGLVNSAMTRQHDPGQAIELTAAENAAGQNGLVQERLPLIVWQQSQYALAPCFQLFGRDLGASSLLVP